MKRRVQAESQKRGRTAVPRTGSAVRRRERVAGVLGGMGPLATADFYTKLVRLTPASTDRDHLRVVIDSNPKIPDRTAALRGLGPDPTPALVATARALERAGAEVIAIPCNSAHAYLAAIRRGVGIPVLDVMEEVAGVAAQMTPRPRAVGLLATQGTIRTRLYHEALASRGVAVLDLTADEQTNVDSAIKAVKAGDLGPKVRKCVRVAAAALVRRGAGAIVLGCTELPLVLGSADVRVPVLDATAILAAATVREALPSPQGGLSPDGGLSPRGGNFLSPRGVRKARTLSAKHHAGVSVPARRR